MYIKLPSASQARIYVPKERQQIQQYTSIIVERCPDFPTQTWAPKDRVKTSRGHITNPANNWWWKHMWIEFLVKCGLCFVM